MLRLGPAVPRVLGIKDSTILSLVASTRVELNTSAGIRCSKKGTPLAIATEVAKQVFWSIGAKLWDAMCCPGGLSDAHYDRMVTAIPELMDSGQVQQGIDILKRLNWVEATSKTETSAVQDNCPPAPERVY